MTESCEGTGLRRFSKLNPRDGLQLLESEASDDTERAFYRHVLNSLDFSRLDEMRALQELPPKSWLHIARFLFVAYQRIKRLGLDSSPPLNLLDLACGPGYVGYVAGYFGHHAVGIDRPGHALYRELDKLLGNERIEKTIRARIPLALGERRFERITAFNASFHKKDQTMWGLEDWAFFIDDLVQNYLAANGSIYFDMNGLASYPGVKIRSDEFSGFICSRGGAMQDGVIIANAANWSERSATLGGDRLGC
jgi:hypothetical protein